MISSQDLLPPGEVAIGDQLSSANDLGQEYEVSVLYEDGSTDRNTSRYLDDNAAFQSLPDTGKPIRKVDIRPARNSHVNQMFKGAFDWMSGDAVRAAQGDAA